MADFSSMVVTKKGLQLQTKAQTGLQLKFTRVGFGDGKLTDQVLKDLTALIHEVKSMTISNVTVTGDGMATIRIDVSNTGLTAGFYIREIGLYANDPEEGEILYAVTNAGEYADFLPAGTGRVTVEEILDIVTVIGNAENVTAVFNDSMVYATKDEFKLIQNEQDTQNERIASLEVEVSILKNAALNNFTHNIFVENFEDLDGVNVTHGVYDKANGRMVI